MSDIPWDKITHINYAFAAVDEQSHTIKVDDSATKMTWDGVPGAEMDPEFAYKGHFNLLSKYKKQYPDVKTLISVGAGPIPAASIPPPPRVTARSTMTASTPLPTRR